MRVSSSLSAMIPSMSRLRASSMQRQLVGVRVGAPCARRRSSRRSAARAARSARSTGACPSGPRRAVQRQVQRQYGVGVVARRRPAAQIRVISSKSARAASRCVTTIARGMPTAAHSSHTMRVAPSTPSARRDDEEGRVRCAQTGPELPDEVGVSGGVQNIDLVSAPFDGDQGELHRALLAVLDLVVVGDGAAVLDPARPVHRPGGQRECLDQGRLARSAVADQHHVPYGRGVVGRR